MFKLEAVNGRQDIHVFFNDILKDKKKVLILSMGGGNDYIGAYMIAKLIKEYYPKVDLVFASSIIIEGPYKPLIKLNDFLFTIDDFLPAIDFKIKNHSIRLIAQGIKNEKMNLPYFVAVNKNDPEKGKLAYQKLFDEVNPDCIFTLDNGGDSITGGLDGINGFDQTNLKTLLDMGISFHHLVIGPGCDGESSVEDFNKYIEMYIDNFRGIFNIGKAVDLIFNNVSHNSEVMLQMDRRWSTMRIIFEANQKVKEGSGDEFFTIPRHSKDQKIPFRILQSALIFDHTNINSSSVPCIHRIHEKGALLSPGHQIQKSLGFSIDLETLKIKLLKLRSSSPDENTILVTLDDGHKDVLLLEPFFDVHPEYQPVLAIPTSILHDEQLWFDRLYHFLATADNDTISRKAKEYDIPLSEDVRELLAKSKMKTSLRSFPPALQDKYVSDLSTSTKFPEGQYLNENDLRRLGKKGWMIASHSHHHSQLTYLSDIELEYELKQSLDVVMKLGGRAWLIYPDGVWDHRVVSMAKQIGYTRFFTLGEKSDIAKDSEQISRYLI